MKFNNFQFDFYFYFLNFTKILCFEKRASLNMQGSSTRFDHALPELSCCYKCTKLTVIYSFCHASVIANMYVFMLAPQITHLENFLN